MAEAYLDLAVRVPTFELRAAGTLDALPEILVGIEAIVVQLATSSS
jgi:hypothetical protein